jgi:hypothetical protein
MSNVELHERNPQESYGMNHLYPLEEISWKKALK